MSNVVAEATLDNGVAGLDFAALRRVAVDGCGVIVFAVFVAAGFLTGAFACVVCLGGPDALSSFLSFSESFSVIFRTPAVSCSTSADPSLLRVAEPLTWLAGKAA